ncbi:restriction endonuclease [Streptomyces tsukubensis]|uniref:restriction endonuclease n=1 Tax=Streptomyces tsukubensis TaxID=83656 RepID=UPI001D03D490|nr:restriction endonuclease [Streptomyces tsukubensis]
MAGFTRPAGQLTHGRTGPARRTLLFLALGCALLCGVFLLVRRVAQWAGDHPVLACVVAVPLAAAVVTLVHGMPRLRELRRAARAGMAEADVEAREAAYLAPSPEAARLAPPMEEEVWPTTEGAGGRAAEWDGPTAGGLDCSALDADAFECAVAGLCERDGCREVEVVGGAGDLGADVLALAPDGRRIVIQCKRYSDTHKVGSQDMQRFGGTCYTVHGADVAAVVTTSAYTAPAREYADTCGILCFDGESLDAWSRGTGPAPWAAV